MTDLDEITKIAVAFFTDAVPSASEFYVSSIHRAFWSKSYIVTISYIRPNYFLGGVTKIKINSENKVISMKKI
jgi:hypothetical protein